jgi:phosphoribosylformimino-5-aminoimidazole carboxamide ribotide isomerase
MPVLTLYPAIDLKDGACVRLRQGDMRSATIYAASPAAQALRFQQEGCQWLHVVDLDGAFAGQSVNRESVAEILAAISIPVQLGGGIRDMAAVEHWLGAGVRRVILGSAAAANPDLVRAACRAFPGRIVVGIDARETLVAVQGWSETASIPALDLALRFEDCGVAADIGVDDRRDGMSLGINTEETLDLAFQLTTPVIASGGIGGPQHLRALRRAVDASALTDGAIEGVVVGRALYEGALDVPAALAILSS